MFSAALVEITSELTRRVQLRRRVWISAKFNRSIVDGTLSILVLDTVECAAVSSMSLATHTAHTRTPTALAYPLYRRR